MSTVIRVSTDPGVFTEPGKTDEPQSSNNTILVAGVAASVFVLVLTAVCIVVMVIWWR